MFLVRNGSIYSKLKKVEKIMYESISSLESLQYAACSNVIKAGGKRLRPLLVLLISENNKSPDKESENQIHAAAAVELIHIGSLIHDDLVDDTKLRRGKKTVHEIWNERVTICSGDALFSMAFRLLSELKSEEMMNLLINAVLDMSNGQLDELKDKNIIEINKERYLKRIMDKTASLIAATCGIGAVAGDCNNDNVKAFIDYGTNIGMAFQIVDDILDYSSDKKTIGKPVGNDFKEGHVTLPLIYATGLVDTNDLNKLIGTFNNKEKRKSNIDSIISIVSKSGAIELAKKDALEFTEKAVVSLNGVKDNRNKEILLSLAEELYRRIK